MPLRMNVSETLTFENARTAQSLFAHDPKNLKLMEERFKVKVTAREGWIKVQGSREGVGKATAVFRELFRAKENGVPIRKQEFKFTLDSVGGQDGVALSDLHAMKIQFSPKKAAVSPKTIGQKKYLEAIQNHDLVFGLGPAGTGKTYLAVAMALAELKSERVSKIILTRPAVEAGEALGFLPGDLHEKISPYLRPLYDALYTMLEAEEIERCLSRRVIEIAPLAYMRGRTLSQSFIILDEAQNTTTEQMFMFLTRIGPDSKCIVTGDPTQIDLAYNRKSGLIEALQALADTPGIGFCEFDERDVVRHELVQNIIRAYRAHRGDKKTSLML